MKSSIEPVPHDRTNSKHLTDWRLYAAAGAAALAAGSAADAAIIYGTTANATHVSSSAEVKSQFPIGNAHASAIHGTSGGESNFAILAGGQFFVEGSGFRGFPLLDNFPLNAAIGGKIKSANAWVAGSSGGPRYGNFANNLTGFAGLELSNGDLGWLRLKVTSNGDGGADAIKAIDWAYNDTPGAPINAGQTSSAVPEPSALGLLAMGSAGVLAWRRRRTAPAR
jgi:hypothetical protein